jgi:hypothetical protein
LNILMHNLSKHGVNWTVYFETWQGNKTQTSFTCVNLNCLVESKQLSWGYAPKLLLYMISTGTMMVCSDIILRYVSCIYLVIYSQ